ncbi:tRNA dimethylallyltransferase [Candidatus Coxiella mudrowiae]|uniref:tRNA dimethylallyltransferase n=2 Tax=Candidatus Coxiella mudrowiae TaxID=2054173 RepID=A0ABN4HUD1_9COXI|nr:tRNA dimethylallyltransferase [Candidatus Coxiella mudrowiae]
MEKHVVCLMGPTASGKTQLAITLTQLLPFEIISVDSAMAYRGLDIGTAKPTLQELKSTPHHLIDICEPEVPYSAGQFYKDALKEIELIHAKNRIPLLVGGAMLYFHALEHGFSDLPIAQPMIRKKIKKEAEEKGWLALYEKLKKIDPKSALQINQNDAQRIQRALEVYETTGQPLSNYQNLKRLGALPYQFINIIVSPTNREDLHQRIEKRFDQMLQEDFLEEVKQLYQRNLNPTLPALRTVGYRQAWQYLEGDSDYETMRYKAIVATRQLAKRQLTWLRQWPYAKWFDSNRENLIEGIVDYLKDTGL